MTANGPQNFFDMFKAMGKGMKLPGVDVDAILEAHRRNLEALEASTRAAAAGATGVMERQRELLGEALRQWSDIARASRDGADPQDFVARQTEFARHSFEAAVKNAGEIAGMMTQSGTEAMDILRKRVVAAMDEARKAVDKTREG